MCARERRKGLEEGRAHWQKTWLHVVRYGDSTSWKQMAHVNSAACASCAGSMWSIEKPIARATTRSDAGQAPEGPEASERLDRAGEVVSLRLLPIDASAAVLRPPTSFVIEL
jgi:hypothetical protein